MPADPALVKKYLADIQNAQKTGQAVVPPPRLHPGNILGGQTDAFIEAVGQQNKALAPHPLDPTWGAAEDEEKRRNALKGVKNN